MVIPYLSVCSGIEAFSVAVGGMPEFVPVAFAEIDDFPSKVLAHHYPDVPNLGDMTTIDTTKLGEVAWLVGGTPCQSFSIAGMRKGLTDDRGNLTLEYVRLAHALAKDNGLRGLLWENVPGVLSDKTNAFGCFLAGIVGHDGPLSMPGGGRWPDAGMVAGPRARLAWRILDSQYFGVAQRRRRVFVVADFTGGFDPATVLFEPRGKRWGFEASGKERQDIAATLSASTGGISQKDGHVHGQRFIVDVAHTLKAEGADASEDGTGRGVPMVTVSPTLRAGGNSTGGDRPPGSDVDTIETLVVYAGNAEGGNPDLPSLNASNGKKGINNQTGLVMAMALRGREGGNMAELGDEKAFALRGADGGSSASMVMAFGSKDYGADVGEEISPTLRASGHTESHANAGAPPAVLYSITPSNSNKDWNARTNDHSQAITSNAGGIPSARGGDIVVGAYPINRNALRGDTQAKTPSPDARGNLGLRDPGLGVGKDGDAADTLQAAGPGGVASGPQVRRLIPEECEKLQGFPVGYTRIPGLSGWRDVGDDEDEAELEAAGLEIRRTRKSNRLRVNDPDGPRYKALGNSFTTEPVFWIMSRVRASLAGESMPEWQPLLLWRSGR